MVNQLAGFVDKSGEARQQKMMRVLSIILDEAMDEVSEIDEKTLQVWIANMGLVMQYVGTGNIDLLPDAVVPFACQIEGIDAEEYLAKRHGQLATVE